MEEYICKYCGKVCKNKNSLVQHEIRCKENPNRIVNCGNHDATRGYPAWNKGLTKQNDPRVAKYANTYKENYKNGKFKIWSDGLTKENSSKINKLSIKVKETVDKKIITDSWHTSFSKARTQVYKGIKMMGNWEVEFAKLLDEKDIKWIYTNDKFDYVYENKIHKYNPDFYLPEFDTYIEIKGYPTKRDYDKWSTSNINNLNIFFGDDLLKLGLNLDVKLKGYEKVPDKFRIKNQELLNKLKDR